MSDEKHKTAIILMGAGMRSTHGAGFLYALGTKLGITSPDIVIGSSGNAGNSLYYVAGQYDFLKSAWTEKLSTPKFISPWRFWRVMDVDYLVDTVFKIQLPLDQKALNQSRSSFYIPITEAKTGKTHYVNKQDSIDVFELLRAAKAAPFVYRKHIRMFGTEFVDGELGPTLVDHVEYALTLGATRILVVDNGAGYNQLGSFFMRAYALSKTTGLREAIIRDVSASAICATAQNATVFCTHPSNLPVSFLTNDKNKLTKGFETGIKDALALEPELRTLFTTGV